MAQMAAERAVIDVPVGCISDMQEMYIVTNKWKLYGAAVMLFPEMLKVLAEIVEEVNQTQVTPEEKLSDTVYRSHGGNNFLA